MKKNNFIKILFLFITLFCFENVKSQDKIVKVYELDIPKLGYKSYENSDLIFKCSILLFETNKYMIYFYRFENDHPITYNRFCLSTGSYDFKDQDLFLRDTINNYSFEFTLNENQNYVAIKGVQCFEFAEWKDATRQNGGLQYFDYRNPNYEIFERKGNDLKNFQNKIFQVKNIPEDSLIGIYGANYPNGSVSLSIYNNHIFNITEKGISISWGTWNYKFGRIDLHDSFFKHTYYCYPENDTTLFYINFPMINTKKDDEYKLVKYSAERINEEEIKLKNDYTVPNFIFEYYRKYFKEKYSK